jgi:16S rRNA (cytosine1402-N4)-methyltransferase
MSPRSDSKSDPRPHIPVMLAEVVDVLSPRDGGVYVDGTFGAGGYSRALLEAADCAVLGIDRDPTAIAAGRSMENEYSGRLTLLQGRFSDMKDLVHASGIEEVDGIALDVGVSSMQLDQAERGFSFSSDGPLDMRMSTEGQSAADVVNTFSASALRRVLTVYGEEKQAKRVAEAIVTARTKKQITRTSELAEIVEKTVHVKPGARRIHPATRTFQGLRIFVNDELGELAKALMVSEHLLRPTGRLAVVSFHSLEDRLVKRFLSERAGRTSHASRHAPELPEGPTPTFDLVTTRAQRPEKSEADINPRARSARLRAAERTDAEAWSTVFEPPNKVEAHLS